MIYHIAPRGDWEAARPSGVYRADSLDTEGFIHCSTAAQVVAVANFLFRGVSGLVLLHVDPEKLSSRVVYENLEGGDERFPHVYGPMEVEAVVQVTAFEPGPDGTFDHHVVGT